MFKEVVKDELLVYFQKKDYYYTVNNSTDEIYSFSKMPLKEKIKIAINPLKNPYSPIMYPIRKKIEYYYNYSLFHSEKILNEFTKNYLDLVNLDNKKIRILDFGCGQGRTIALMNRLGFMNIIGQDITNFDYWRKLNASFVKIPLGAKDFYPYKDEVFDIVFSLQVRMYLDKESLINHIKNISRILKVGGIFIFEDRNDKLLDKKYYTSNRCCPYIHNIDELKELLQKNSFEVIKEKTYGIDFQKYSNYLSIARSWFVSKENFDIFDYYPKSKFDNLLIKWQEKGKEPLHLMICKKRGK